MASLFVDAMLFVGSLVVLLWSSDAFTSAVGKVGLAFGISPFVIGATVVAGGTSLPEFVSSVQAARIGEPTIVIGNVVGSNIANIFLVLGIAAVVGERIRIERELMRVDLPILVASAVFLLVAVWDGPFRWYEGLLALAGVGVYTHFTLSTRARLDETVQELVAEHAETSRRRPSELDPDEANARTGVRTYLLLVVGIVLMFASADQLVRSLLAISSAVGVGVELVAITAVGVGTSLPEIAVSVTAIGRSHPEIAVGNVLGSNVFNTFAVMGVPSLITPIVVPPSVRSFALPVMVLATVLYYFITQDRELTRWEGAVLLILYVTFVANLLG